MKNLFIVFLVGLFFFIVTDAYKLLPFEKGKLVAVGSLNEEENDDETNAEKDGQLMDMEMLEIKVLAFSDKPLKQKLHPLICFYARLHSTVVSPPPEA